MVALRGLTILTVLTNLCCAQISAAPVTPGGLWTGRAHFEEIGSLEWPIAKGAPSEQAASFAVKDGIWYAFNRSLLTTKAAYCPQDHAGIVVRASIDHGKSWTNPVPAADPGMSKAGDGCAVLDGSVYYDAATATWHMLAQCLDRENTGGWSMCHYTRTAASPLGRFSPDAANPVVVGGQLWSRICAGAGKACPKTVTDEGTPDIIGKRNNLFVVTIHGFDAAKRQGYRGVVATPDFRKWQVTGNGLPGDAILGPRDCAKWLEACAGTGEATTLLQTDYLYMVVETMDKSLGCLPGQKWVFQILRARRDSWPRSTSKGWQRLPSGALLTPTHQESKTPCALQYARWIQDDTGIYLVYEEWGPGSTSVRRRILKLTAGGGKLVRIRS